MKRPFPDGLRNNYGGIAEVVGGNIQGQSYAISQCCGSSRGYHERARADANYINITSHSKVKEGEALPDLTKGLMYSGEDALKEKDSVVLYDKDGASVILSWVDETKEPK